MEYALRVKGSLKNLFLVHGEAKPAETLSEKLVQAGMDKPAYPALGESVEV
jgi:hypothetical protein